MPDYRETVEKLRTATQGVCAFPVDEIQYDADGYCLKCHGDTNVHLLRGALTLLTEQEAELATLRDWKESAMSVLAEWDALADALKPYAKIRLGDSIAQKLAEQIPAELATLRAENARLREAAKEHLAASEAYRIPSEVILAPEAEAIAITVRLLEARNALVVALQEARR